eukprot:scaffold86053_cov47-Phaeocystis_antarctica.AAC.3
MTPAPRDASATPTTATVQTGKNCGRISRTPMRTQHINTHRTYQAALANAPAASKAEGWACTRVTSRRDPLFQSPAERRCATFCGILAKSACTTNGASARPMEAVSSSPSHLVWLLSGKWPAGRRHTDAASARLPPRCFASPCTPRTASSRRGDAAVLVVVKGGERRRQAPAIGAARRARLLRRDRGARFGRVAQIRHRVPQPERIQVGPHHAAAPADRPPNVAGTTAHEHGEARAAAGAAVFGQRRIRGALHRYCRTAISRRRDVVKAIFVAARPRSEDVRGAWLEAALPQPPTRLAILGHDEQVHRRRDPGDRLQPVDVHVQVRLREHHEQEAAAMLTAALASAALGSTRRVASGGEAAQGNWHVPPRHRRLCRGALEERGGHFQRRTSGR